MERTARKRIVGIVASAGGPPVLVSILKLLPEDLDVPVVVVQHMPADYIDRLIGWLASVTDLRVKLAEDGEALVPGVVYVVPATMHMTISLLKTIELRDEPAVDGHKLSGTVLLKSMAESYGDGALGIVLTGMGSDGASGLKDVCEAGGHTIAQDFEDCSVDGMPKAAVDLGAVNEVLPSSEIAARIVKWVSE